MNFPVTPYKIKKAYLYWKHFGTKEFFHHLTERMEPDEVPYGPWFEAHRADEITLKRQRGAQVPDGPLISVIVPAYKTPEKYFMAMAESVLAQSYMRWELIIADGGASLEKMENGSEKSWKDKTGKEETAGDIDGKEDPGYEEKGQGETGKAISEKEDNGQEKPGKYKTGKEKKGKRKNGKERSTKGKTGRDKAGRDRSVREMAEDLMQRDARVRYIPLDENYGIAGNTNKAMEAAGGEYYAFLDHDDLIEPDALYELAVAAAGQRADLIYTDEDKLNGDRGKFIQPHLKPEFNLDLLRSNNYMTHFLCVRASLASLVGGFDESMSGAQDHDFIFRCAEQAKRIVRIPRILYHWRTHGSSTADNPMSKLYAYEAGKRAIEGNLERMGVNGTVELLKDFGFYRVHYPVEGNPKVSVIIPNRDQSEALSECIDALLAQDYGNIEIIIVENSSEERETFLYYRELAKNPKVKLVRWKKLFNYSAINNYGVRYAEGDYLLFLNNDVRGSISTDWLRELLGVCQRRDVGAVGPKLLYPDKRIQSAGVVIGIGGIAGSMFVDMPSTHSGYLHKASIMQDLSAVTAACMLCKKSVYEEVGGFPEELAVAFNDVDFCLRIGQRGYRIVYDPFAVLYHDESRTRGPEDSPDKQVRFQNEIEYFRCQWTDLLKRGDPNYNPNLSLRKWNYSLRV